MQCVEAVHEVLDAATWTSRTPTQEAVPIPPRDNTKQDTQLRRVQARTSSSIVRASSTARTSKTLDSWA